MVKAGWKPTKEAIIKVPERLDEKKCRYCEYSYTTADGWCYMFKHKPIYECSKFKEFK